MRSCGLPRNVALTFKLLAAARILPGRTQPASRYQRGPRVTQTGQACHYHAIGAPVPKAPIRAVRDFLENWDGQYHTSVPQVPI